MTTYDFTLVLDRVPTDGEIEALYESGCDDATPETEKGVSLLHFDREAESLAEALLSAILDAERAGLRVHGAQSEDLVSLKDIASRTGRTYESVRLMAVGQRGPGGFPAPLSSSGYSLYSWAQVREWYLRHGYTVVARDADTFDREIAAADHMLRARVMLSGDSHRATFERLLTV